MTLEQLQFFTAGLAIGVLYIIVGIGLMIWFDARTNKISRLCGDRELCPVLVMLFWPLALPLLSLRRKASAL